MPSLVVSAMSTRQVVRLLQVASGVALVVLAVTATYGSRSSFLLSCSKDSTCGSKRGLQNIRYDMPLQEQNYGWSSHDDDRTRSRKHSHEHDKHSYRHHHHHHHERDDDDDDSKDESDDDHESDNDDDDSKDEDDNKNDNDDDDSKDEDDNDDDDSKDEHDNDNDDSKDEDENDDEDSESQSGSGNDESSPIQSSVVTNLDGVNIGNTITIINIGNVSVGQQSGSTPVENEPNATNPFTIDAAGRSAITSAAARAFCDSLGCGSGQFSQNSTSVPGLPSATFPPDSVKGPRLNESAHELPSTSSGRHAANLKLHVATWLLLASVLAQYL